MAYWLVKSEPSVWSWDQQVAKGAKGEPWTGVRNQTAKQNLEKMKKGDLAFYYHSNEGKEIVDAALNGMRLRFRSVMMTALSLSACEQAGVEVESVLNVSEGFSGAYDGQAGRYCEHRNGFNEFHRFPSL